MNRLEGVICGNKRYNEGTLSVLVTRFFSHSKYHKKVRATKKYLVQCDSKKLYELGTNVIIQQCAPVSKKKTWKVVEEIN